MSFLEHSNMLGKMMNTFTTIASLVTDLCFAFPCDNFASKSICLTASNASVKHFSVKQTVFTSKLKL